MEKRKRRGVYRKVSISDESPKSSQMDSLSEKKLCNEVESISIEPNSSQEKRIIEKRSGLPSFPSLRSDVSVKAASQSSQLSVKHNHLNRSLFVSKPRYCDWKYSLRNLSCNADASTSHGKGNAQYVEKLISNDPRLQTGQSSSQTQERNMSSVLAAANIVVSGGDSRRILCGICERSLSRNPINVGGNSISGGEPSVVAVLVCGHLYHADCLEQKTCVEERMDPSCHLCV